MLIFREEKLNSILRLTLITDLGLFACPLCDHMPLFTYKQNEFTVLIPYTLGGIGHNTSESGVEDS